ncbi:zinc finger protein CONSTANS-LIKE 16 [Lolium perenne]|uniref:zinc finger protein CONSTANS-LIKE 16 n=1 Tax=Lolium perenne TaxID=4522 RepID=UPI0021F524FC|nr:zinc finger protein CONSTANS-LIKE 6-like [Lolium perenne]
MTNAGAAALGARTARACDGCMRRRARWHCAADDAYLCQACDASVHSANPLARRHHRVRLSTASSSTSSSQLPRVDPDDPAWVHGLKRRPRTPRSKPGMTSKHDEPAATVAVPDLEAEDSGSGIVGYNDGVRAEEEEEVYDEDLLYRVPVFDPMLAELYNPVPADEGADLLEQKPAACCFASLADQPSAECASGLADGFSGFDVVPDMELASFAADMESLLMGGVEEGFDDLRFLDEEKPHMNLDFDMDMDFDDQTTAAPAPEQQEDRKRKRPDSDKILKLDYEGVIDSWARDGGSPWFHGERPHFDPNDSWLDLTSGSRGFGLGAAVTPVTGGEREARVSRYREKRRTRLFAKKIRYEVRKLNAEKRPRMKGRFVKRTALPPLPPRPPMMVVAPHGHGGAHGRFRF